MDTFAIGRVRIGKFILTVSHTPFINFQKEVSPGNNYHDFSRQFNLDYYDVSLVELDNNGNHYYIDLVNKLKGHDSYFDFARPVKNLQDEKEIAAWSSNKTLGLQMPMWNLRKVTVQRLTNLLYRLAEEKTTLLGA